MKYLTGVTAGSNYMIPPTNHKLMARLESLRPLAGIRSDELFDLSQVSEFPDTDILSNTALLKTIKDKLPVALRNAQLQFFTWRGEPKRCSVDLLVGARSVARLDLEVTPDFAEVKRVSVIQENGTFLQAMYATGAAEADVATWANMEELTSGRGPGIQGVADHWGSVTLDIPRADVLAIDGATLPPEVDAWE